MTLTNHSEIAYLRLLLLHLLVLLLRLRLRDGSEPLLGPNGGGLIPPCGDGGEVSTNNTTLVLHSLARALLGDFLGDTFLVHAAVNLCPGDLAGVLALQEERSIFGAGETEDLKSVRNENEKINRR